MSTIQVNSQAEFTGHVNSGKLAVADFYADWCGPCKQIAPVFAQLAAKHGRTALFLKVDCDKLQDVATACGIKALPTFHFYHNGQKVAEMQGADPEKLTELVDSLAKKHGTFVGAGHSLTGATNAAAAAPSGGEAPRRRNPWADPNWVPPGMRKKAEEDGSGNADHKMTAETAPPKRKATSVPTAAFMQSKPPQPDAASAPALAPARAAEVQVDGSLLEMLTSMGFPEARCQQALVATKNANLDVAIDWLSTHDTDDSAAAAAAAGPAALAAPSSSSSSSLPTTTTTTTTTTTDAGVMVEDLDMAPPAADAPTLDDSLAEIDEGMRRILEEKRIEKEKARRRREREAKRKGFLKPDMSSPAPAVKAVSDMSSEEKEEWLEKRRVEARKRRVEKEREMAKMKERTRKETGKAAMDLKRKQEELQAQAMIAAKKKAKEEEVKSRKRVREKVRLEKERRAAAREKDRRELERIRAEKAAAAAAAKEQ